MIVAICRAFVVTLCDMHADECCIQDEYEINLAEFGDYIMSMLDNRESAARQSDNSDMSNTSFYDSQRGYAVSAESIPPPNSLMGSLLVVDLEAATDSVIDPDLLLSMTEILAAGNNSVVDAQVGHLAEAP